MPGNAGFNATPQGLSGDNLLGYLLNDVQIQTATIINEAKVAEALGARIPGCVYRLKGAGFNDDSAYSNFDPVAFANTLHALAPPGCWLYGGNEFGSANLGKQDDWTNRFVERCAQLPDPLSPTKHRRPMVHNQFTQHPESGIVGWQQLKSSTLAAMQAGGGVGPHCYWRTTPAGERAVTGRNAFMAFDELRQIHGEALIIFSTEFAYDRSFGEGYVGRLSDENYAAQCLEAAQLAWDEWRVFVHFYGLFPPGSEWDRKGFNLWFNETIKPKLAAWNRSRDMGFQTMVQWQTIDWGTQKQGIARIAQTINIRALPDENSADVGDLHDGDVVTYFSSPYQATTGQKYLWYKLLVGNVEQFVAKVSGLHFEAVGNPVEPPSQNTVSADVYAKLVQTQDALDEARQAIAEVLDEVTTQEGEAPPDVDGGF